MLPSNDDKVGSCVDEPEGLTFSSMDSEPSNELDLNWQGACMENDAWTFYVKVYRDTGSNQCTEYTLDIDFPYSTFNGDAACTF